RRRRQPPSLRSSRPRPRRRHPQRPALRARTRRRCRPAESHIRSVDRPGTRWRTEPTALPTCSPLRLRAPERLALEPKPWEFGGGLRPPPRKLPSELLEVDRPLLDERVASFHRLWRLVVEVERGGGELRHARSRLGVDVEGLLRHRQRGR